MELKIAIIFESKKIINVYNYYVGFFSQFLNKNAQIFIQLHKTDIFIKCNHILVLKSTRLFETINNT